MKPFRAGDRVRYAGSWCDRIRATPEIRRMVGTIVWVDRTSPNYTLIHVVWDAGGASRAHEQNLERAGYAHAH